MARRILYGVIAVVASFMLADSLTCNSCSLHVLGYCVNPAQLACTENSTEQCFTGAATFSSINTTFAGFRSQGCMEPGAGCGVVTESTVLGAAYSTSITCCNATDLCNAIVSGAPTTQLSLTAALSAAVLASVWGTVVY